MSDSSQTPVLVGVAQVLQREDDLARAREPFELMVEAVREAAEDAGAPALLARAQAVRVIRGAWRYGDPGRAIAKAIGSPTARTSIGPFGGNSVQTTVSRTCLDIQSGALDVAIITGAECGRSRARARKAGTRTEWSELPGEPDEQIGHEVPMAHEAEIARGIRQPVQMYPVFENALRYQRGESVPDHLARISELWAGFSEVAAGNPHAWIRERKSAEEIRTPGPANRPISFPYTKLMNSNSAVDMGAALILTSVEAARSLGVPEEKMVFPWVGTDAHDHYMVSNRPDLHSSPAIRIAGRRALELAGLEAAQLDHVDVYSCFPSAVQVGAAEIGLPDGRPLTVTGGLTFGGGPLNNYVMHSIARMAEVLRERPGTHGLCTANGGFLTKHAFGIYSAEPPAEPFRHEDLQSEVDALPTREVAMDHLGEATLESYTVMYGPDGPERAHAACLLPDGRRTWANSEDPDLVSDMTTREHCGRAVELDGAGSFSA